MVRWIGTTFQSRDRLRAKPAHMTSDSRATSLSKVGKKGTTTVASRIARGRAGRKRTRFTDSPVASSRQPASRKKRKTHWADKYRTQKPIAFPCQSIEMRTAVTDTSSQPQARDQWRR